MKRKWLRLKYANENADFFLFHSLLYLFSFFFCTFTHYMRSPLHLEWCESTAFNPFALFIFFNSEVFSSNRTEPAWKKIVPAAWAYRTDCHETKESKIYIAFHGDEFFLLSFCYNFFVRHWKIQIDLIEPATQKKNEKKNRSRSRISRMMKISLRWNGSVVVQSCNVKSPENRRLVVNWLKKRDEAKKMGTTNEHQEGIFIFFFPFFSFCLLRHFVISLLLISFE